MFTIQEIVRWLGLTVFEIWINLNALVVFTVLLALKFDHHSEVHYFTWWAIFFPLFAADALNAYFCVIVFIRMQLESSLKASLQRLAWSANFIFMMFIFKFLLCKKLTGQLSLDYSEIFAPVYILLQLVAVRACQQT
ncbi:hypothetical protein PPYR_12954 [Photinus pyralis]|uniref:Transmembrane protein 203 n=1 Tax=Photinus pyralis TaxID=7054 RepID=A0A1Y1LAQ1_PHOPY|nr:transmembrane protein 203 [Photinus pyralis]KAB0793334.1 hypothetical protein PPYR_12954 [Photinus pyralis]